MCSCLAGLTSWGVVAGSSICSLVGVLVNSDKNWFQDL